MLRSKAKAISGLRRGTSAGAHLGRQAMVAAIIVLTTVVLPAAPASASLGSVPAQVGSYVTSGALVARLADLYGPGKHGTGIDFDATTKPGPISRVFEWTQDRYAHPSSPHPIQLTNNWVVPITIGDKPVGLATIWINPQSVLPELAQFTAGPDLATAIGKVPADAALVRDAGSGAWFAVAGGTATPLVAGKSGVDAPAPVDQLALIPASSPAPEPQSDPNTGLGLALGVVGVLVIVIVVALVVPGRRRRAASAAADGAEDVAPSPPVEPVPEAAQPLVAAPPKVAKGPNAKPPVRPGAKPAPRTGPTGAKPPVRKPPGQKPSGPKPPTADAD